MSQYLYEDTEISEKKERNTHAVPLLSLMNMGNSPPQCFSSIFLNMLQVMLSCAMGLLLSNVASNAAFDPKLFRKI